MREMRVNRGTPEKTMNRKPEPQKSHYVYLLLCDDGSYYTGYRNNVASRFERHMKGHGTRYTRMHRPKRVVYVEEFKTRGAATRREQRIKGLSHREKRELVTNGSRTSRKLSVA